MYIDCNPAPFSVLPPAPVVMEDLSVVSAALMSLLYHWSLFFICFIIQTLLTPALGPAYVSFPGLAEEFT